jgi:hypothetical protein
MFGNLTVEKLREFLAGLPGDLEVAVQTPKRHVPLAYAVSVQEWELMSSDTLRVRYVVIAARPKER